MHTHTRPHMNVNSFGSCFQHISRFLTNWQKHLESLLLTFGLSVLEWVSTFSMAVSVSNPPTTLHKTNHKTRFLYWEYLGGEWSNHWCKAIRMKQAQKLKTWWSAEGPKVLRWQLPWHTALERSRSGFALQSPSAPVGDFLCYHV